MVRGVRKLTGAIMVILMLLVATGSPALGADPRVQLTRVTALGAAGDPTKLEFEMSWVAAVPALTTLDGFDAGLEVQFSNGSKQQAMLSVNSASRMARFRLPKPPSGVVAKRFWAQLTVRFTTAAQAPLTVSRNFHFPMRGRQPATGTAPGPVTTEILDAKLINQGCAEGDDCFDLKWAVNVNKSHYSISRFDLKIDIAYQNGVQKTASHTAGKDERQARLSVSHPSGTAAASLRATLDISLAVPDTIIVRREGEF